MSRIWCAKHLSWDDCETEAPAPGPFDHLAAPELSIYEAPTEKTIVGVPPAPLDSEGIDTSGSDSDGIPEMDAAVLEFEPEPTIPVEAYEEVAIAIDAAAAPVDPVFDAQKKTLAAVFEAMLAEGVPAGTCNKILFAAVAKLGLTPTA